MKVKFFFRWFDPTLPEENKDTYWKLNDIIFFGQSIGGEKYPQATHVGVIYAEDEFQYFVYQSEAKGFVKNVFSKDWFKPNEYWRFLEVEVSCAPEEFIAQCDSLLGTPYDFFDYVRFFGLYLFGKRFFKSDLKAMVCSVSIAKLINDLKIANIVVDSYISPSKDYDTLINNGGVLCLTQ